MPFHQLPPEILHHILGIVLQLDDSNAPNRNAQMRPTTYYRGLYNTRSVCRRWDDVIVSSPRFWSLVDLSRGERGVKMVLDRAGAVCPLFVVCWHPAGDLDKTVELMLPQMPRVRSLQGVLTDAQFRSFFPILRCRATLLHHVGLSCAMNNTVHGALFAGHTPCLRSLFLSGVVADLNTQTFPHVASLNLSFTTTKLGDLSTLLMGCPRLVNLYLDAITFTRQTQDVRGPIFLPDLRTFTIRSPDSPEVAGLLSRIQAPYCRIWCVHEATVGSRFYPPEIIFRPFMEHVAAAAKGSDPFTPARLELGPDRVVCKFGERCYRLGILLSVNYPIWAEVLTKLIAVWGDGRGREVTVESFGWLSPSSHPRIDIPSGWKVLS